MASIAPYKEAGDQQKHPTRKRREFRYKNSRSEPKTDNRTKISGSVQLPVLVQPLHEHLLWSQAITNGVFKAFSSGGWKPHPAMSCQTQIALSPLEKNTLCPSGRNRSPNRIRCLIIKQIYIHSVRSRVTGLLTGIEYSKVVSTAWVRPISTVTTRTAVELA